MEVRISHSDRSVCCRCQSFWISDFRLGQCVIFGSGFGKSKRWKVQDIIPLSVSTLQTYSVVQRLCSRMYKITCIYSFKIFYQMRELTLFSLLLLYFVFLYKKKYTKSNAYESEFRHNVLFNLDAWITVTVMIFIKIKLW